jgi:dGTPase
LEQDHSMAERVVRTLFRAWIEDPSLLPESYRRRIEGSGGEEKACAGVSDYIAGMTDGFILQQYAAWQRG